MDSRIPAVTGGVTSLPSRTIIRHAPGPSATVPRWFRIIAVSYPSTLASVWASRLFW